MRVTTGLPIPYRTTTTEIEWYLSYQLGAWVESDMFGRQAVPYSTYSITAVHQDLLPERSDSFQMSIWFSTRVEWPYRFEPYFFAISPDDIFWKDEITLLTSCSQYDHNTVSGRTDFGRCIQTWRIDLGGKSLTFTFILLWWPRNLSHISRTI